MRILAIDLGQDKSVFCDFDSRTGEFELGAFTMESKQLRGVLTRRRPERVVVEICPLAASVHDLALELGIEIEVADTTRDAWKWKNVKRKTDRDDAIKLARLSALGQINRVHIPAPAMRQWRRLVEHRQTLVGERTRCKNRIRALLRPEEQRIPAGKKAWSEAARVELWSLARPLDMCPATDLWRGILEVELQRLDTLEELLRTMDAKLDKLAEGDARTVLVKSIPGVGWRTAEAIVTALDDPHRFTSRRQVSAYAGLTPRRYQSGKMDRQGRISKQGRKSLRAALNQAAWSGIRCNGAFREFYLRLGGAQKSRRKQAIVAVMRKLLVLAWALLRDGRRYEARRIPRSAAAAAAATA